MIISVPLTDIPRALFILGCRRRTLKVPDSIQPEKPAARKFNCIIIDSMGELQSFNINAVVTFIDVGQQIMDNIVRKLHDFD